MSEKDSNCGMKDKEVPDSQEYQRSRDAKTTLRAKEFVLAFQMLEKEIDRAMENSLVKKKGKGKTLKRPLGSSVMSKNNLTGTFSNKIAGRLDEIDGVAKFTGNIFGQSAVLIADKFDENLEDMEKTIEVLSDRLNKALELAKTTHLQKLEYASASVAKMFPSPNLQSSSTNMEPSSSSNKSSRSSQIDINMNLWKAAKAGLVEEVIQWVDAGANPNFLKWTPLLIAALNGHASVVGVLLNRGADINATTDDGTTALHYATCNDHSGQCVRILINAGAPLDVRADDGNTPFHWAAVENNRIAFRLLSQAGANKTIRNNGGMLASDLANSIV